MKRHFASKTLIALAVAIAAAAGYESLVNAQPIPPPASAGALPANIPPGTPVAEVVKLAQAGVEASVIQTYIANCPSAFNLDADQIVSLTDAGVSSDMVNAMINHDKNLTAAMPQPVPSGPVPTDDVSSSPPPAAMTVDDFNNTLTPYGQWVQVDGYGRCWRPTAVVYDSTWQPYCDHGSWVYTDCGWYWNSDYSWGVTFHYGRWFHHDHYGWCWWPDSVWAPSWVTWRSSGDYCGWAPLPPYSVYRPGVGFIYRGANVSVGFDFGLAANCFTFVSVGRFCDPHPRNYCVPHQQITQVYNQTTIINNYNSHNHTIVNNGVPVNVIGAASRHPIQPVNVGTLRNAGHQGWQGGNVNRNANHNGTGSFGNTSPSNPGGTQGYHNANQFNGGERYNHSNTGNGTGAGSGHRPPFNPPTQPANRSGEAAPSGHPQNPGTPSNPQNQRQSGFSGHSFNYPQGQNFTAQVQNHPRNNWLANDAGRSPVGSGVNESLRHFTSPVVGATAPVASSRPQPSEARQNYVPSAPRNIAPPVSPGASSARIVSPNGGGKAQNWAMQNR